MFLKISSYFGALYRVYLQTLIVSAFLSVTFFFAAAPGAALMPAEAAGGVGAGGPPMERELSAEEINVAAVMQFPGVHRVAKVCSFP